MNFQTEDIRIAAAVLAKEASLFEGIVWGGSRAKFTFSDGEKCREIEKSYIRNELAISAKDVLSAFDELRALTRNRGGNL